MVKRFLCFIPVSNLFSTHASLSFRMYPAKGPSGEPEQIIACTVFSEKNQEKHWKGRKRKLTKRRRLPTTPPGSATFLFFQFTQFTRRSATKISSHIRLHNNRESIHATFTPIAPRVVPLPF